MIERSKLAKRYRSLWIGETVASCLFIVLFLRGVLADGDWRNWIVRGYALFLVLIILAQGVYWWRWKLRTLRAEQRTMPINILQRFALFKRLNWLLIGLFPLVLLVKWWLTSSFWLSADVWFGILFVGGAILEQINYYYYQLMYDNPYDWNYLRQHRMLRVGSIAKALAQLSD